LFWREDRPTRRTFMQESPSRGPVTFDSLLSQDCTVSTSLTVARREVVVNAGPFDERFPPCEDFDLWLRIAFRGARMTFQREVLACHRLHKGSLSASEARTLEAQKRVYENVIDTLPLSDAQRAVAEKWVHFLAARIALVQGKQSLLKGDYANARSRLESANAHFRRRKINALLALLNVAPSSARSLYAAYLRQVGRFHENHLTDRSDADRSSPAPPKS
jgi:GT2 family glycosyltransferase